ncbi:hypothetical protein C5167_013079 [Papaver somniferum]|uniref:Uncharacterized protein n=1 Tax=Papaver somniferum TaxID=3469 RepID=A0A4Y7IZB3_PAPSO|nr:protein FAM186A-like [Papaver somniferum]RZC54224.1 hypothetical protein C5167_013079 [Papaver somniferum]
MDFSDSDKKVSSGPSPPSSHEFYSPGSEGSDKKPSAPSSLSAVGQSSDAPPSPLVATAPSSPLVAAQSAEEHSSEGSLSDKETERQHSSSADSSLPNTGNVGGSSNSRIERSLISSMPHSSKRPGVELADVVDKRKKVADVVKSYGQDPKAATAMLMGISEDRLPPQSAEVMRLCADLSPEVRKQLYIDSSPEVREQLYVDLTPEVREQLYTDLTPEVMQQLRSDLKPQVIGQLNVDLTPKMIKSLTPKVEADLHRDLTPKVEAELRIYLADKLGERCRVG